MSTSYTTQNGTLVFTTFYGGTDRGKCIMPSSRMSEEMFQRSLAEDIRDDHGEVRTGASWLSHLIFNEKCTPVRPENWKSKS